MTRPHATLDLSDRGRVFAAGDVHGEYGMLDDALAQAAFDVERDALVLVGDIADRGPDSMAALDWIARPWVHRTLGNHDIMPRMRLDGDMDLRFYQMCGCQWFLDLPGTEQRRIAAVFEDAPLALTVLTPGGRRVGIAHADCLRDWDAHVAAVSDGPNRRIDVVDMSLWSKETVKGLLQARNKLRSIDPETLRVANIDHVFHGHTILGAPVTIANRSWIDTGACMGGDLTVVDMDRWIKARSR